MFKLLFLLGAILPVIYAWPGGAPPEACETFVPNHGPEGLDPDTAEFFLQFKKGQNRGNVVAKLRNGVLPLKIRATPDKKDGVFKGFLVQGRNAATNEPAGSFIITNKEDETARMQNLLCSEDAAEATVTHTDNDPKDAMTLLWQPPANAAQGSKYYFQYTIVKDYDNYWTSLESPTFAVSF